MNTPEVISIVIICYLIGMGAKSLRKVSNESIPVIVGICGAILGIVGMRVIPDFPANNVLDAIAIGIVSGMASVGVNQISKIGKQNADGFTK